MRLPRGYLPAERDPDRSWSIGARIFLAVWYVLIGVWLSSILAEIIGAVVEIVRMI